MCRVVWYSGTTGICGTSNICVGLCGIVGWELLVRLDCNMIG